MPVLNEHSKNMILPTMHKVRQRFDLLDPIDIELTLIEQFQKPEVLEKLIPGQKVGIAVGSRGISNIDRIIKLIILELQKLSVSPVIIPAMGSHGGGTAEGQKEVLKKLNITEETMGVPIKASMDVTEIGKTDSGVNVYFDSYALGLDGIVVVNRVKAHTDFRGELESGLCKMLAIGLGNHVGCSRLHQEGFERFHKLIPEVADVILKNTPVLCGVALIENAFDETCLIETVIKERFFTREANLLEIAKRNMPRIQLNDIDVLIVKEIGKDISGAGMDPNITGRTTKGIIEGFNGPLSKRIIVLDLTKKTNGNATGIGLADFTTKKVFQQMDFESTYANSIASGNPEAGKLPVYFEDPDDAIKAAIATCPRRSLHDIRIVKIKNTLELEMIEISDSLVQDADLSENLEIIDSLSGML